MYRFEANFFLTTLMHSEVVSDYEECVKLFKELLANAQSAGT
jgi:uncharacterized protein (DUF924 family)